MVAVTQSHSKVVLDIHELVEKRVNQLQVRGADVTVIHDLVEFAETSDFDIPEHDRQRAEVRVVLDVHADVERVEVVNLEFYGFPGVARISPRFAV